MMRRTLLAAAFSFAAALPAALPAHAQTLEIALREDADILDPTLARTYVGRIVFAGLCDKLFDINSKLQVVPQLATGYEWTDPKTLVLTLREGVTFQDGEPFDAAAVKYTLERDLTMQGSFRRSEINAIDHIDVVDPHTVRIVLKAPSAPFLAQLTDRAGMIVAPKAAEAAGKDFGLHPVCTGPFSFVERVPQDRIVLQRYPGYWNKDAIHFDKVIYLPIADSSVRLANLEAGSIDLSEQILPNDVAQVKRNPNLTIVTSRGLGYQGITFNLDNGPRSKTPIGQNALLRQAFDLAIDRQALVQVVYNGVFSPTVQGVSADSPYYDKALTVPARDIAKAKELIKQAGVPTPIPVTLNVPNSPDIRQAAEVIQSMVKEAGFDLKLNTMEFASSLQAAAHGDFEGYLIGWSGRTDPDGNLWSFLHTGGGQNDGRYSNATVDSLLDRARVVSDVGQRADLYAQMWTQERKDLPIIYLWTWENIVGMSKKVHGFVPVPDGMIRLQGMSLAE